MSSHDDRGTGQFTRGPFIISVQCSGGSAHLHDGGHYTLPRPMSVRFIVLCLNNVIPTTQEVRAAHCTLYIVVSEMGFSFGFRIKYTVYSSKSLVAYMESMIGVSKTVN